MRPIPPKRKTNGQFPTGVSGNPQGRPKPETTALRQAIAKDGEKIIAQIVQRALEGDMTAAKIVLDRILPPLKPVAVPVTIEMPPNPTPVIQAEAILAAASSGKISSDIAAQLIQAVAGLTRIIEVEDLKERLEALERITCK